MDLPDTSFADDREMLAVNPSPTRGVERHSGPHPHSQQQSPTHHEQIMERDIKVGLTARAGTVTSHEASHLRAVSLQLAPKVGLVFRGDGRLTTDSEQVMDSTQHGLAFGGA